MSSDYESDRRNRKGYNAEGFCGLQRDCVASADFRFGQLLVGTL